MSAEGRTSLRAAALIAGLALLTMAIAAPYAEMYVYPKIVVHGNPAETAANILANRQLFVSCIFGYLVAFLCDIVAAWALFILFKPVHGTLSLLTAWFRLVYTVIAIVALLHLVTLLKLLDAAGPSLTPEPNPLYAQVTLCLGAFRSGWSFGILFFGVHLCLLGYLVLRSSYVPLILGVLLIISGLGYIVSTVGPYLFPGVNLDYAVYTFYGELIFMLWLLLRGSRIQDSSLPPF